METTAPALPTLLGALTASSPSVTSSLPPRFRRFAGNGYEVRTSRCADATARNRQKWPRPSCPLTIGEATRQRRLRAEVHLGAETGMVIGSGRQEESIYFGVPPK